MAKEKRISIRLSESDYNQLFEYACESGLTITQVVVLMIKYFFNEEDF